MIQPAGVLLFCLKLLTIHGVGLSDDGVIQDENVKPLKIDLKSLDGYRFFTDMSLGTPPQKITVAVDTNSREIMVPSRDSDLCIAGKCKHGAFDSTASNTTRSVADECLGYIHYPMIYCEGFPGARYVKENFAFAGHKLSTIEVGLAIRPVYSLGVFGMGYPLNFRPGSGQYHRPVRTLLKTLSHRGIIPSASVSLKFSDPPSMILGGIDTSAFVGKVALQPIMHNRLHKEKLDQNQIRLASMSVAGRPIAIRPYDFGVALSTSNLTSHLPVRLVAPIKERYNINYYNLTRGATEPFKINMDRNALTQDHTLGPQTFTMGAVDCALQQSTENISFTFDRFTIDAPVSSFIFNIKHYVRAVLDADLSDFKIAPDGMFQQCGFAINGVLEPFLTDGDGTTPYSLGMAVLRHVYLIQSQDSHQVGFARLNPDPLQKSVVRPIAQGDDGFRFTLKKYVIYDG